jgi:hypothetical protein
MTTTLIQPNTIRRRAFGWRKTSGSVRAVPLERLFVGVQYDYGINYPKDLSRWRLIRLTTSAHFGELRCQPRLELSLSEAYISTLCRDS